MWNSVMWPNIALLFALPPIYAVGLALTFFSPWPGVALAVIVASLCFLLDSPFDGLLDGRAGQKRR